MDIRIEKTEKAIRNAFIELRSKKPVEKITVKELCQLAYINKSTFYSHYEDIYALSDALELETVASITSISRSYEYSAENLDVFTRELCLAFSAHTSLINILFSGKEKSRLAGRLETAIKELVFRKYPEYQNNVEINILLSYCIQGAYYAYVNNQSADTDTLIQVIENIARTLKPLYCP